MTAAAKIRPVASPNPLARFWWVFRENPGAVGRPVGHLGHRSLRRCWPTRSRRTRLTSSTATPFLTPPAFARGGTWRYPLGTDDIGRDILSRIVHGARLSLLVGGIVVSLSLAAGILLGLLAGFTRGIVEIAIMRSMDIMLALPALLLAIVIVAVLGPGLTNAMYAIAIVSLPHYVRLTRAAVIAERTKDYVIASRLAGAGVPRLAFVTVLPNCLAPLIVQATLGFSTAVLDVAALGFLGLGAQPPTPEWGTMLADARQFMQRAWWVVTFPGLAILVTVLSFNLLGDGLRDALDPRMRR